MSIAKDSAATQTLGPTVAPASESVLRLPAQCGIREAAQLLAQLMLRIEYTAPVYIDAAQVERVDTAALQLLVAFLNDRKAQQRAVVWLDCSEALMRAARSLGLTGALALASAG